MNCTCPVMTSVTTTIIVFSTFFFIDGRLGKFMWQASLVVIASLAFSLVEAFLILPSHLAHSKGLRREQNGSRLRGRIDGIVKYFTKRVYAPVLRRPLDGVRVLGTGEIKSALKLKVDHATASAKAAIEKAGGSVSIIEMKVLEADEKKRAKSAAKKAAKEKA